MMSCPEFKPRTRHLPAMDSVDLASHGGCVRYAAIPFLYECLYCDVRYLVPSAFVYPAGTNQHQNFNIDFSTL